MCKQANLFGKWEKRTGGGAACKASSKLNNVSYLVDFNVEAGYTGKDSNSSLSAHNNHELKELRLILFIAISRQKLKIEIPFS